MEKSLVNPAPVGRKIPADGILLINPGEADMAVKTLAARGYARRGLFNTRLIVNEARAQFVAGPAVGAPMAAMTLEHLIVLGAKRVIVYGWAGAVDHGVNCGDIVIPDKGLSGDGTSGHYLAPGDIPQPAPALSTKLEKLCRIMLPEAAIHRGAVWTNDAPYRETAALVEEYRRRGAIAVEMEFCALAAVAAFRGIELAAVFMVSDSLAGGRHESLIPEKNFRQRSRDLAMGIIEASARGFEQ